MSSVAERPAKQGREAAAATAAAPAAPAASLVSLPESLHLVIADFLGSKKEQLAVAVAAKSLLPPFGCHFESMRFYKPRPGLELGALERFIGRQEALLELAVPRPPLLPAAVSAIAAGIGRHLRRLQLGNEHDKPDVASTKKAVTTLAGLFVAQLNCFPALEEMTVSWQHTNHPSVEGPDAVLADLLAGLTYGGAPRLQKLRLAVAGYPPKSSFEDAMKLLAAALEARAAKGCAGLAELDLSIGFDWLRAGSSEVQRRLWSVLLPTLQSLPETFGVREGHGPIMEVLLEQGAPCLRRLEVLNMPLVRGLAHFTRLEELHLRDISLEAVAALEEAIAEAGGAQRFLPALQMMELTFYSAESEKAFFAAMGRTAAFPQLQKLQIFGSSGAGEGLAAGAFARLERLKFYRILGDEGLAAMVEGLAASPCARTLQFLEFGNQQLEGGAGLRALGEAIGASAFPALTELRLDYNRLGDEGLVELMTHLKRGPPLSLISLLDIGCGDVGTTAVARALQCGGLGSGLRSLQLGETETALISDTSMHAFVKTLVEGRQYVQSLEKLRITAHRSSVSEARALVEAAVANCPQLKELWLSGERLKNGELDALQKWAGAQRKGLLLVFIVIYKDEDGDDWDDDDDDDGDDEAFE